jgi:hypothetical protein
MPGLLDAMNSQSKTIKTTINITTDEYGKAEIPLVTGSSGYQTKVVQATLRKYCIAHIHE